MAIETSRRTSGALLALLAVLAVALGLYARLNSQAERSSETTVLLGDRCVVAPTSCLSIAPVAIAIPSLEPPTTEAGKPFLVQVEPDAEVVPSGSSILVPTPPPRSS
jgi:hypothetical protein